MISGYEKFRDDLALMYFADIATTGSVTALEVVPLQIRNFRLGRPSERDVCWLHQTLDRECRRFGTTVTMQPKGRFGIAPKDNNQPG